MEIGEVDKSEACSGALIMEGEGSISRLELVRKKSGIGRIWFSNLKYPQKATESLKKVSFEKKVNILSRLGDMKCKKVDDIVFGWSKTTKKSRRW